MRVAFSKPFASTSNQLDGITFNSDVLHSRILLGTAGRARSSLDSDNTHIVIRIGFPTSIINFIQEIERCGRNKDSDKI